MRWLGPLHSISEANRIPGQPYAYVWHIVDEEEREYMERSLMHQAEYNQRDRAQIFGATMRLLRMEFNAMVTRLQRHTVSELRLHANEIGGRVRQIRDQDAMELALQIDGELEMESGVLMGVGHMSECRLDDPYVTGRPSVPVDWYAGYEDGSSCPICGTYSHDDEPMNCGCFSDCD
jgi:hypothetical protein